MTFFKTHHKRVYEQFGTTVIGRDSWTDKEIEFLKLYQQFHLPNKHTKMTAINNWKAIFNLFVKNDNSN